MPRSCMVAMVLCFLVSQAVLASFDSKDAALQAITSTHTRVFSRENLLLVPIAEEDNVAWNKLVENLQEYASRRFVKTELKPYLASVIDASFQILNSLRTTYQKDIMPALYARVDQEKGLSSLQVKKIDLARINFQEVENQLSSVQKLVEPLKKIQDELQEKLARYRASSVVHKSNGDTAETIIRLAFTMQLTAEKIAKDLKKLEEAAQNREQK